MSEVTERIKMVRKTNKLSQEKFGNKLGITRDAVNNIERNRVQIKESTLLLVCRQFNVSYDWLKYGEGEMDLDSSDDSVMTVIKEKYDIDELDEKLIREYLSLTPHQRASIKDYFKQVFG